MLLESIKEITKDGRIITGDSSTKDEKYKGYEIIAEGNKFKVFPELPGAHKIYSSIGEAQDFITDYLDEKASRGKDSQYTKAEYSLKILSLTTKLSKAKQLGDSEEAKEIQKEIDELKALEGGVQDAKAGEQYHVEQYSANDFYVEDPVGGDSTGPFKTRAEAQRECEKRNASYNKDSDTEAKITDLTEKAKAARAQGYAADQYEAEIEKLKAKDKKTKDSQRDDIEKYIDKLEDDLEEAKKNKNENKIKEIRLEIERQENRLRNYDSKDAYDEVDWLTLDPLTDKGKEILASMKKEYGDEQGEKIFYASKNAGKITGVDSK